MSDQHHRIRNQPLRRGRQRGLEPGQRLHGETLGDEVETSLNELIAETKRRVLDDMDAAEWLFYSVKGEFPASPRIPTDPASQERARQAQAAIEARKVRNFTVTQDAEGNVIITLDDGTVATIPTTN